MGDSNVGHTEVGKEAGLHVCPACNSGLVQPVRWERTDKREHWRLWRRCPECEWRGEGVHGPQAVDAYDDVLDEGSAILQQQLAERQREGLLDVAESFCTALETDLITADDFR